MQGPVISVVVEVGVVGAAADVVVDVVSEVVELIVD